MKTQTNTLAEFKELLKMNDVAGDPWGVCMSAFFDVAAHLYEKGNCPVDWEFKVGWGGNVIDEDSAFFEMFSELDEDQLTEIGNYLKRITDILIAKGKSY